MYRVTIALTENYVQLCCVEEKHTIKKSILTLTDQIFEISGPNANISLSNTNRKMAYSNSNTECLTAH